MRVQIWRQIRWIGSCGLRLVLLISLLWGGIGFSPAGAVELGHRLDRATTLTTRVGGRGVSLQAIEEHSATEDVQAVVNGENEVFEIEISSTAQQPPEPSQYLGDYARFPEVETQIVPLRGKIVTYQMGDRRAQWRVFGQSGQFSAQAIGFDLAPVELTEE